MTDDLLLIYTLFVQISDIFTRFKKLLDIYNYLQIMLTFIQIFLFILISSITRS